MRNAPSIISVARVVELAHSTQCQLPDGRWVPARPLGYFSFARRLRAAWLVFAGKADALIYPGQP